jgi:AbrB family looped-hinge helix DNA binding protein
MTQYMTHIGHGGRLVIPAEIRRKMGVKTGDAVGLRLAHGILEVITFEAGVKRAQQIAAPYLAGKKSLADELIAERRAEARGE